ncbi:MAG TPA: DinB family protein [Leptospiraceae bacterium]|nr:DinB family protein [Leptospiraceae bacterium]HMW07729.1 DinB family protein [Leptospiraceae bacterium]HMX32001.1 DinB family protein [Leptospiraceae bacterium]HMY33395.1 DinB family protein [Leptospiraceae bacterium]HMZ64797.1 DinB family protein [Leptospiraceae bacterium]
MILYELFPHWETRTNRILKSLENRTPYELDFKFRSNMRSLGNLYRHIISAEIFWMEDVVAGRGQMFSEIDEKEFSNAKSISDKWRSVRNRSQKIVKPFSLSDLKKTFQNPRKKSFDLNYILWHVVEHEIHHSGQISAMLRAQNLPSPIN